MSGFLTQLPGISLPFSITYKTNGAATTKSMTEWYFGQGFVKNSTAAAVQQHNASGKAEFKFWQNGTGYMTVCIH